MGFSLLQPSALGDDGDAKDDEEDLDFDGKKDPDAKVGKCLFFSENA